MHWTLRCSQFNFRSRPRILVSPINSSISFVRRERKNVEEGKYKPKDS